MRWLIVGVVAVLVLVVGGPFVYFHFIEGKTPAKLTLSPNDADEHVEAGADPSAARGHLEDRHRLPRALPREGDAVRAESHRGRSHEQRDRVDDDRRHQGDHRVVQRRHDDRSRATGTSHDIRDGQFQDRIMDTADFPTATFTLTKPIDLGTAPDDGVTKTYSATGKLTLHGTTKTVTISLTGRRTANVITVVRASRRSPSPTTTSTIRAADPPAWATRERSNSS